MSANKFVLGVINMRRFFTEPENIKGNTAYIKDDASHITKVLRMNVGDEILVFDGTGYEYTAKLKEINKIECIAEITERTKSLSEPEVKITLFQGLPKASKMEYIVQKAVELGVYEIVPVEMERCVVRLNDDKSKADKVRKWQKVSVEAVKQCGRGKIPQIAMPIDFKTAVSKLKEFDLAIMPYEIMGHDGDKGLKEILKSNPQAKRIAIIVGSEGGFSDSEAMLAKENGIFQCGLGKRILRTETVGSALISIIMYEKDEM